MLATCLFPTMLKKFKPTERSKNSICFCICFTCNPHLLFSPSLSSQTLAWTLGICWYFNVSNLGKQWFNMRQPSPRMFQVICRHHTIHPRIFPYTSPKNKDILKQNHMKIIIPKGHSPIESHEDNHTQNNTYSIIPFLIFSYVFHNFLRAKGIHSSKDHSLHLMVLLWHCFLLHFLTLTFFRQPKKIAL